MILADAVLFADVIRVVVLAEITFGMGFLAARWWKRRNSPLQYLSLMALALVFYSAFAFLVVADHWGTPLAWRTPIAGIAATVAFIAIMRDGYPTIKKGEK